MQNPPNMTELPESVRNIMKASIEQARKAFDTFVATSEKMIQGVDTSSSSAAESVKHLNERIAAFTRQNAEANFNLALRMTEARQLSDIVELQSTHVRDQMEAFTRQMEELRDLTMSVVREGTKTANAAMREQMSHMPKNPMGS
jgi:phasin